VPRFSTGNLAADELVYSDAFAFLLACCLDRGRPSEIIWAIPYHLKLELGHLDPNRVAELSVPSIHQTLERLPERPRYMHDAPHTVQQLARIIATEFGGRPEALWEGRSARDVLRTLRRIRGVDTIANMTVNLLHRYLGVPLTLDDLRAVDVKPDVHVERVFVRCGLSPAAGQAVFAARLHSTEYPAALDLGAWEIGRGWCLAQAPHHEGCPLAGVCPRIGVG
jgi:endonuclease III